MTPPASAAPRLLFHVQHLLGIGHLRRAATLARALADAGFAVTVAAGGEPVPGIDFGPARIVQLPPARAGDAGLSSIVDAAGRPVDADWWAARRWALLALFHALAPQVLLIELYPFGRRAFRQELLPLLEAAAAAVPRPVVLCSLRDILVEKPRAAADGGDRVAETVDIVRRHFDRVLVHGDPRLVPLSASFPGADAIAERILYTGYVVDRPAPPAAAAAPLADPLANLRADPLPDPLAGGEVLVSAGGGAVGGALLRASLAARPLTTLAGRPWRLVTGPNLPAAEAAALGDLAGPGVRIERFRPDLAGAFARCAVSVSQGGYNTVMELIAARARAVVVPFAAPGESEQTRRARLLAARGLLTLVEADALSPARLAAAIDAAAAGPRPPAGALDLDGAAATGRLIVRLLAEGTGR